MREAPVPQQKNILLIYLVQGKGFHRQNLRDLAVPEIVHWLFEFLQTFECTKKKNNRQMNRII